MKQTAIMTPQVLIRKLVTESRPEGGSIFLDDFCGQCPEIPRADCVAALKNSRDVLFIVGRKGHLSRAVYGRMKDDYRNAPSFKSPWAAGPVRHHTPQRQTRQTQQLVAEKAELDPNGFRLKVTLHGQEIFVPIDNLELVPTA